MQRKLGGWYQEVLFGLKRARSRARSVARGNCVKGALVFATLLAAGLPATPGIALAASGHVVNFTGHYSGTASLLINNGKATISSVHGKGSGTLVGNSTVTGTGSASASAQCDPFTGTGSIVGATAKILLTVLESKSSGCSSGESGPVTVTFTGIAKATGGTGKTKGASGTLKFSGTLKLANTNGSQNGPFTVVLTGKLTVG